MSLISFSISTTKREELINITKEVERIIEGSTIENGLCIIYVPHTTAAITINESEDPDVVRDIVLRLGSIVPHRGDYSHLEGNSDAHIKSALIGNSRIVIVEKKRPLLGRWEGIFFCEFDGPRTRKVCVKII